MELKDSNGLYVLTPEEKKNLDELKELMFKIKQKWFSLGRDIDRFVKLSQPKS